jgi:hypothetical protein
MLAAAGTSGGGAAAAQHPLGRLRLRLPQASPCRRSPLHWPLLAGAGRRPSPRAAARQSCTCSGATDALLRHLLVHAPVRTRARNTASAAHHSLVVCHVAHWPCGSLSERDHSPESTQIAEMACNGSGEASSVLGRQEEGFRRNTLNPAAASNSRILHRLNWFGHEQSSV